ncbi:MAG: YbfB/YjiJ family MFS transporter, partial [Gammaproteobacteria bacterium]
GQWWLLTLAGALLALPAWFWMPRPSSGKPLTEAHRDSGREPCKSWLWLLQGAYALAGFGYVVQATFLVLITEEAPGMEGKGGLMWLLAGLAAAPATLLWDRIARRVGYLSALQWCFAAQIVSLMIPVFWGGLSAAIAASVLAGGTFIGIVSLVLTMVGRLFPAHPASIMAKLTLGYSVAQIVGPVLAGEMAEASGTFAGGLLMAVGLMALGWIGLLLMRRVERRAVV